MVVPVPAVMVGPLSTGPLAKVPVATFAVGVVVNTIELLRLVMVTEPVDSVALVKVPPPEAALPGLAVNVTPLTNTVPVTDDAVNVPVALAAVGGLASKTTPSTVSVELPLMLDELSAPTVPVRVAAKPPRAVLQSFFSFPLVGALGDDSDTSGIAAATPARARCWMM
jgi:hypothetical protein